MLSRTAISEDDWDTSEFREVQDEKKRDYTFLQDDDIQD